MTSTASWLSVASTLAATLAGCPDLPKPCDGESRCPSVELGCVDGVCVPVPVIVDVDSDGAARDIAFEPAFDPAGVPRGARPAIHRLRHTLVVRGRQLDDVDEAVLDDDDARFSLTVLEATGGSMRLALPEALVPGLFTLTLVSAAGVAAAEVFVLQGEPGPSPAFRSAAAAAVDCASGGQRLFFGADDDGDGVLDADEEDGATLVCNGDDVLTCVQGRCTLPRDLAITGSLEVGGAAVVGGSLDVGGALGVDGDAVFGGLLAVPDLAAERATVDGLAVAARLTDTVTVTATTEAELRQRLDDMNGVAIAPGALFIIELPVTVLALTAPIFIEHPDGGRLHILGKPPLGNSRTTVVCPAAGCFFVGADGLGFMNDIDIAGAGVVAAPGSIGLQVTAGRADLGANMLLRDLAVGLFAADGAFLNVGAGTLVTTCGTAYFAFGNSVIGAAGTQALNNSATGYLAQFQSTIVANDALAQGNQRGFLAVHGGLIFATGATLTQNQIEGVLASEASYAACVSCVVTGNHTVVTVASDATAVGNSLVTVGGSVGTTVADATSTVTVQ